MLYSFIPPILIILSLIGIILFLIKKYPQVRELSQTEAEYEMESDGKFGKWKNSKNLVLTFLEKLTRVFRVVFLKLESKFSAWGNDIRIRRRSANTAAGEIREDDDIIKKIRNYKPNASGEISEPSEDKEEKKVKAIISDKIVKPKSKAEIKDRLEEILIERIAVNPRDIEAYERLGEYYMDIKSYDFAKECFKQIVKLDSGNRNAKYKMKRLESILGK